MADRSGLVVAPGVGERLASVLLFGSAGLVLIAGAVGYGPAGEEPGHPALVALPGLMSLLVASLPFRQLVLVDDETINVRQFLRWTAIRRSEVCALLFVHGAEAGDVCVVTEVDGRFDLRAAGLPPLRRRQYERIAAHLGVPFLGPGWRRSIQHSDLRSDAVVSGIVEQLQAEHVSSAEVRPAWLIRAFPVGVLYVVGVLALVFSVPIGTVDGTTAGLVAAVAGVAMVAGGELVRRLLRVEA